ncbi:hypothetical protein Cpin_4510 [Chitinophaga pinensis DSM 2588]|uniref:Uncharacterized protein n=1 Tax=Chitinophaga pinensis (strain ATCC 43595 / DSM 2588 / LMG 13176 / NBRC 15968 / NCIMB 11800 / UQM 2034) TaxID=485918 RepID=A0A979G7A2_CHIPD|nr:hypothetical protein Cpin_4510 [Chitinophaga pinensis DSM 2588]
MGAAPPDDLLKDPQEYISREQKSAETADHTTQSEPLWFSGTNCLRQCKIQPG